MFDAAQANAEAKTYTQNLDLAAAANVRLGQAIPVVGQSLTTVEQATTRAVQSQVAYKTSADQMTQSITSTDTTIKNLGTTVSGLGAPFSQAVSTTQEYEGVLNASGTAVKQFEATSATMAGTLGEVQTAVTSTSQSTDKMDASLSQVEPSIRQIDSGLTEMGGSLKTATTLEENLSRSTVGTKDAMGQLAPQIEKSNQSLNKNTQEANNTKLGMVALAGQMVGVGTSIIGLVTSFSNLERTQLALDKSSIGLEKSTRIVNVAYADLSKFIAKTGVDASGLGGSLTALGQAHEHLNQLINTGQVNTVAFDDAVTAVHSAVDVLRQKLLDLGVPQEEVNNKMDKFSQLLDSQVNKAMTNSLNKSELWANQLQIIGSTAGTLIGIVGSVATITQTFGTSAQVTAGLTRVWAGAMGIAEKAADALKISVRSLMIATGIGIALAVGGFIFDAISKSAEASSQKTEEANQTTVQSTDKMIQGFDKMSTGILGATEKVGQDLKTMQDNIAAYLDQGIKKSQDFHDAMVTNLVVPAVNVPGTPKVETPPARPHQEVIKSGGARTFEELGTVPNQFAGSQLEKTGTGLGQEAHAAQTGEPGFLTGATGLATLEKEPAVLNNDTAAQKQNAQARSDSDKVNIAYNQNMMRGIEILATARSTLTAHTGVTKIGTPTVIEYAKAMSTMGEAVKTGNVMQQIESSETLRGIEAKVKATAATNSYTGALDMNDKTHAVLAETMDEGNKIIQQRQQENDEVIDQENTIAQAFGQRIKLSEIDADVGKQLFQIAKDKITAYKGEEMALIGLASKYNVMIPNLKEIVSNEQNDVKTLSDLITANQTLVGVITDRNHAQELTTQGQVAGRVASIDFYESTIKQIAADKQQLNDLDVMAKTFGVSLPQGVEHSIENMQLLIQAFEGSSTAAKNLVDQANEAHKALTEFAADKFEVELEGKVGNKGDTKDVWKALKGLPLTKETKQEIVFNAKLDAKEDKMREGLQKTIDAITYRNPITGKLLLNPNMDAKELDKNVDKITAFIKEKIDKKDSDKSIWIGLSKALDNAMKSSDPVGAVNKIINDPDVLALLNGGPMGEKIKGDIQNTSDPAGAIQQAFTDGVATFETPDDLITKINNDMALGISATDAINKNIEANYSKADATKLEEEIQKQIESGVDPVTAVNNVINANKGKINPIVVPLTLEQKQQFGKDLISGKINPWLDQDQQKDKDTPKTTQAIIIPPADFKIFQASVVKGMATAVATFVQGVANMQTAFGTTSDAVAMEFKEVVTAEGNGITQMSTTWASGVAELQTVFGTMSDAVNMEFKEINKEMTVGEKAQALAWAKNVSTMQDVFATMSDAVKMEWKEINKEMASGEKTMEKDMATAVGKMEDAIGTISDTVKEEMKQATQALKSGIDGWSDAVKKEVDQMNAEARKFKPPQGSGGGGSNSDGSTGNAQFGADFITEMGSPMRLIVGEGGKRERIRVDPEGTPGFGEATVRNAGNDGGGSGVVIINENRPIFIGGEQVGVLQSRRVFKGIGSHY